MGRRATLLVVMATIGLLAGCASTTGDVPDATHLADEALPADHAEARERADAWLDGAVVPPDAISVRSAPDATPLLTQSYYAWPCSPTMQATGYWTLEGATVAATGTWLGQHPTADLIVTTPLSLLEGTEIDALTVGNSSTENPLEGIAFTVARTPTGVAIRAEVGAVPESATCPQNVGGPGQG
jgi:hypothetical protein